MLRANSTPTPENQIKDRAHHIWEREGRPHGRELDHWRQAEAEIAAERAPAKSRSRAAPPANRNRRKEEAAE